MQIYIYIYLYRIHGCVYGWSMNVGKRSIGISSLFFSSNSFYPTSLDKRNFLPLLLYLSERRPRGLCWRSIATMSVTPRCLFFFSFEAVFPSSPSFLFFIFLFLFFFLCLCLQGVRLPRREEHGSRSDSAISHRRRLWSHSNSQSHQATSTPPWSRT